MVRDRGTATPPHRRRGLDLPRRQSLDSRDVHFAVRVGSYDEALQILETKGYREDADDELMRLEASPKATAAFTQIDMLDPDRHVIEINAEKLDG